MSILTRQQRNAFSNTIFIRTTMTRLNADALVDDVCTSLEKEQAQREDAARTAACSAAHMMGIESSQANTIITTYLKALEK